MKKFDKTAVNPQICRKKEMIRPSLYTAEMKMADLIQADYKLLLLLERFGMTLGFGDQTVASYCKERQVQASLMVMICNVYSFDHYLPGNGDIAGLDIQQLLLYLQRSHKYYLENRIKAIQENLSLICKDCGKQHALILNRFFEEYKNEVINHFDYEEKTVFPYVLHRKEGKESDGYSIEIFEQNHTNIEDKLNDLKNIIIKYLPDRSESQERIRILFGIFSLEEDLGKHSLIEDKILIPLVQKLEFGYDKH